MPHKPTKAIRSWGSLNRDSSADQSEGVITDPKTRSTLEEELSERLLQREPASRERVVRAFKSWNLIVREHLRNETGLRLSVGDDIQPVPVRVVDGLPDQFLAAFSGSPEEIWLIINRPLISKAAQGLQFVDENFRMISGWKAIQPTDASAIEVSRVRLMVERLDAELSRLDLTKRILAIQKDVLGVYSWHPPTVQLYWMAIVIIAGLLSVPVEALTVVVLAHELTHAYTHLGRDIDGVRWHTDSFAGADVNIIEGLAQYYTETLSGNLDHRIPGLFMAYQKLLEGQSGPYVVHQNWAKGNSHAKEIVRGSLIECRTRRVIDYEDFGRILERLSDHISGRA
jgi:hypothetical protein